VSRDRGVALVLVLAITGVLSLLILQIGLSARQQVAQAQSLLDRSEAALRLHSREAALLYSLLTRAKSTTVQSDPAALAGDNPYAGVWNFRGDPFEIDGAVVRLQDMSGLLPTPTGNSISRDFRDFAALLVALGTDEGQAEQASRALQQSLSTTPASSLQSFKELPLITGLSIDVAERLEGYMTLYPTGVINPGTAPLPVLAVKYGGSVLEGLMALRSEGSLDSGRLVAITGESIDDMTTTFDVGPGYRLDLTVAFRGVRLRRESVWTVRPANQANPLELWSYRDRDPVDPISSSSVGSQR